MQEQRQTQHQWLDRLVGSWTVESEATMGPGQPPMKAKGKETVRALAGLWFLCEDEWAMPDGAVGTTVMTLGYDPAKGRYIGSFVGSMMNHMWIYDGALDPSQHKLVLDTIGPNFSQSALANYQDMIEFISDDHRQLTSQIQDENGNWTRFMVADYRRVGP